MLVFSVTMGHMAAVATISNNHNNSNHPSSNIRKIIMRSRHLLIQTMDISRQVMLSQPLVTRRPPSMIRINTRQITGRKTTQISSFEDITKTICFP